MNSISESNGIMHRSLKLIAGAAFWSFALPASFASDPSHLDKVGEVVHDTRREARARIKWIMASNLPDKRKIELLRPYIREGDTSAKVEKLLGPWTVWQPLGPNCLILYYWDENHKPDLRFYFVSGKIDSITWRKTEDCNVILVFPRGIP